MVSAWMIGLCFCMLQAPATERTSSAADIDLGLFARVVSSDPVRSDGARAGRLEEFRVEDVFLTTELAPSRMERTQCRTIATPAVRLVWNGRNDACCTTCSGLGRSSCGHGHARVGVLVVIRPGRCVGFDRSDALARSLGIVACAGRTQQRSIRGHDFSGRDSRVSRRRRCIEDPLAVFR